MREQASLPDLRIGRRHLIGSVGLAAISAAIGATIPFGRFMPAGYVPIALAQDQGLDLPGKSPELAVLGDKPLVAETPAHLRDVAVPPPAIHFIRNTGLIPDPPTDPDAWSLTVDGEVAQPLTLTLAELKDRFENVTLQLVLECGGNGRSQFVPAAKGNPWATGGVGWAGWSGVRPKDWRGGGRGGGEGGVARGGGPAPPRSTPPTTVPTRICPAIRRSRRSPAAFGWRRRWSRTRSWPSPSMASRCPRCTARHYGWSCPAGPAQPARNG